MSKQDIESSEDFLKDLLVELMQDLGLPEIFGQTLLKDGPNEYAQHLIQNNPIADRLIGRIRECFRDGLITSERKIPLIGGYTDMGNPTPEITVEDWVKWYKLYVVGKDDDGKTIVTPLHYHDIGHEVEEWADKEGIGLYGDHMIHPKAVIEYARRKDYYINDLALELMVGRWETEILDNY